MLSVHWKAPLQAKGFLKIIEFFVAILAFSLVAGFSVSGTLDCGEEERARMLEIHTSYPYKSYTNTLHVNNTTNVTHLNFVNNVTAGGELFVTWGVLTMFYCIVAIAVYMLFTANENMEKVVDFLIYVDLAFHIAWVLCWFIASVVWAYDFNYLRGQIGGLLDETICSSAPDVNHGQYAQAAIAVVFGFLSLFLWAANIYWVLIDTAFYIQWKARRAASNY